MERSEFSGPDRRHSAIAAAVSALLIGFALSFGLWALARGFFFDQAHDRLDLQADTLAGAIERAGSRVEFDLRAVAGLFEADEEVTLEEFNTMIERIQPVAGLGGIAYAPVINAGDLAKFTRSAQELYPDYMVYEVGEDGPQASLTPRSTYLPVLYFFPAENTAPLGLDVASVPGRLPHIEEALTGRTVSTPIDPVAVFNERGYVAYQPILGEGGRVVGLVVGPVLLDAMIEDAVPAALAEALDWTFLDGGATEEESPNELVHVGEVKVGSQVWTIQVRPAAGSSIMIDAWRPAAVIGIAGVALAVLAALATFWFWKEAQATARLESLGEMVSSKDRFVATVSHELRTPLAAVLGFSELLKDGRVEEMDAEERNEIIGTIAEQASDLADIVEDLLVLARADHGTLTAVAVPVDVSAQCRQVIERISLPHPIQVNSPNPGTVRALADPGRVRQVIRNLLANAASYGGDQTWMEIRAEDETVIIGVSDDGSGVDPDQADRIFEPYRAHKPGATSGSLGLGLSVSRTLARHMAGDLTYSHTDGITTFELTLPKAVVASANDVSNVSEPPANTLQYSGTPRGNQFIGGGGDDS